MVTDQPQIGQLVYYTMVPLAMLMKVQDAGNLWKVGIVVKNINSYQCIIMGDGGKEEQCWTTMVRKIGPES
tara:strand:- start:220 stop:432 length:213 start_codon:yes stop_codon:yes gene_type:complete